MKCMYKYIDSPFGKQQTSQLGGCCTPIIRDDTARTIAKNKPLVFWYSTSVICLEIGPSRRARMAGRTDEKLALVDFVRVKLAVQAICRLLAGHAAIIRGIRARCRILAL
jgi:hypothetical protein